MPQPYPHDTPKASGQQHGGDTRADREAARMLRAPAMALVLFLGLLSASGTARADGIAYGQASAADAPAADHEVAPAASEESRDHEEPAAVSSATPETTEPPESTTETDASEETPTPPEEATEDATVEREVAREADAPDTAETASSAPATPKSDDQAAGDSASMTVDPNSAAEAAQLPNGFLATLSWVQDHTLAVGLAALAVLGLGTEVMWSRHRAAAADGPLSYHRRRHYLL